VIPCDFDCIDSRQAPQQNDFGQPVNARRDTQKDNVMFITKKVPAAIEDPIPDYDFFDRVPF
jgi:hypothetical protein